MSRIGKQPVVVPGGVKVAVADGQVSIEGPLGKLALEVPSRGRASTYDEAAKQIVHHARRAMRGRPGPCTA